MPKDNTARYKYLSAILKEDGRPLTAKALNKKTGGGRVNPSIVIGQEVRRINLMVKIKLGLQHQLILSDEGHRLNIANYQIIYG